MGSVPSEHSDGAPSGSLEAGQKIAPACPVCGSQKVGPRYCTACGSQLVQPVIVTHAVGPMWAVNGHVLTVSAGEDLRRSIFEAVARLVDVTSPTRVVVSDGTRVTRIVLRLDGSSVAEGDDAAAWAGPVGGVDMLDVPEVPMTLVGVHAGAGASMWSRLLDLPEAQLNDELTGTVVLVCRSTPTGINAAKSAIHARGTDAVDAVLVVADAPGKPIPAAARELRVLAGAMPVVPVPWIPRLRAVAEISPALAGQLARPVQRVTKALQGAQSNKEKTNDQ